MTICIAAIHSNDTLITASDRKISFSASFSTEGEMTKFIPLKRWIGLMAGEDVSPGMPILRGIAGIERGDETVEEYTKLCRSAYLRQRIIEIESQILGKYDLTLNEFKKNGKAILTDKVYEHVFSEIEEFHLGCSFLFGGFDCTCAPHLFVLSDPGRTEHFDRTGYWAIGTGRHATLSHLASYPYRRTDSLGICVYRVMAAKIASECARDVGKSTYVCLKFRDCPYAIDLSQDLIDALREGYESLPRLPKGIDKLAEARIKHAREYVNRSVTDKKDRSGAGIETVPLSAKLPKLPTKPGNQPMHVMKPRLAPTGTESDESKKET